MLTVKTIDGTNHNKHHKGHEQEIDDVLEKITIGNMSGGIGAENIRNIDRKFRKIETAGK